MNLLMVGAGYVGIPQGVGFAQMGHHVTVLDTDAERIAMLQDGELPIYEEGLDEKFVENIKAGRLRFTTDYDEGLTRTRAAFIAVGTPPKEDGEADVQFVEAVAREIGRRASEPLVVADKSTVPVGTAEHVESIIQEELRARGADFRVPVVSNPEFLREGTAWADVWGPDRVIIGADDPHALDIMRRIYDDFTVRGGNIIETDRRTAELTKYVANAYLALKISFMNEVSRLGEALGTDQHKLRKGVGADGRIGDKSLYAGPGYGGSCFPKDTRALRDIFRKAGIPSSILDAVIVFNESQKRHVIDQAESHFGDLEGLTFGMLGLAFKDRTDDMRESPAITMIGELRARGASVRAYDPQAMENAKRIFGDNITYCSDSYETAIGADALVVATNWSQFRGMDIARLAESMSGNTIFDTRNIWATNREELGRMGLNYYGTGFAPVTAKAD